MNKINVAIVHGIGNAGSGYSQALVEGLKEEFNRQLKAILATGEEYFNEIKFQEIVWGDILSERQRELKAILQNVQSSVKSKRCFNLFKILFRKFYHWLRTAFAAESIGDVIGYKNPEAYKQIHKKILDGIDSLNKEKAKDNITFIAHSLGTVIASDFIYDRQKKIGDFHSKFRLSNFFTLGSPLALFALRYDQRLFGQPIKMEDQYGRWVNIFDKDDPIAYSLKPLDAAYQVAVLKDQQVDTGCFGISHLRYWQNHKVHQLIGRKLAIDWLRINNRLSQADFDNLYQSYDKDLGLNEK
ncbi:hypothetical protein ACFL1I_06460 [Candidatus Omnitrophota bacterium]